MDSSASGAITICGGACGPRLTDAEKRQRDRDVILDLVSRIVEVTRHIGLLSGRLTAEPLVTPVVRDPETGELVGVWPELQSLSGRLASMLYNLVAFQFQYKGFYGPDALDDFSDPLP